MDKNCYINNQGILVLTNPINKKNLEKKETENG
jgi:hypothetical protein